MQLPAAVSHRVAGPQSPSSAQATQWSRTGSQIGVAPAQVSTVVQLSVTQVFDPSLQTLSGRQSLFDKQPTHTFADSSQTPVAQSALVKHVTQRLSAVLQRGVAPPQSPSPAQPRVQVSRSVLHKPLPHCALTRHSTHTARRTSQIGVGAAQ
jgi:hypothetical protein